MDKQIEIYDCDEMDRQISFPKQRMGVRKPVSADGVRYSIARDRTLTGTDHQKHIDHASNLFIRQVN